MRQLPGFIDGLIHQSDDPGRFGSFGKAFLGELLFLNLAHECDPGKVLPQTVVQS